MIVSHRYRFIFVKTHKTAGSSLEMALGALCGADDIVSHMEDNLGSGVPRNYHAETWLGRNYDRHKLLRKLVSRHSPLLGGYFYEHMPAWRIRELVGTATWDGYFKFCFERNPWDKVVSYYLWKGHGQGRRMPSFRDYVLTRGHRLPVDSRLYCDDAGTVLVDRVYEFRELGAALAELRERVGVPVHEPLPGEKTGIVPQRRPYRDYYDDETRDAVARLFRREIELLGYEF